MKRILFRTLAIAAITLMSIGLYAQNPPHPNGGSGPIGGNTPVGGGAPIDGGITIMLVLGAAYGGKKLCKTISEK